MNEQSSQQLDFELPNVGRGSESIQATNLATEGDQLLIVLLGSHYCSRSRELVRTLSRHHEAFRRRSTTVVPVLPDIRERARIWDRQYSLPFPMLADPADERGDDAGPSADSHDAFGVFEPLAASMAERPAVALCRSGESGLTVIATETEAALEAPIVESLLEFVDRHRATDRASADNAAVDS